MVRPAVFGMIAAATLVAVSSAPAAAQNAWTQVGSRVVNAASDSDTLFVSADESHSAIRICAVGQPFALRSGTIFFAGGASQALPALTLSAGQCSDAISLSGRGIDRVVVNYTRYQRGETAARVRIDAR